MHDGIEQNNKKKPSDNFPAIECTPFLKYFS